MKPSASVPTGRVALRSWLARKRCGPRHRRPGAGRARTAAERAKRQAEYWRRRAATAEQRMEGARQKVRAAEDAAQRARRERDEAQRLLKRKLQWSRDARVLRNDPDALLALVAELRIELDQARRELALTRRLLDDTTRALAGDPLAW